MSEVFPTAAAPTSTIFRSVGSSSKKSKSKKRRKRKKKRENESSSWIQPDILSINCVLSPIFAFFWAITDPFLFYSLQTAASCFPASSGFLFLSLLVPLGKVAFLQRRNVIETEWTLRKNPHHSRPVATPFHSISPSHTGQSCVGSCHSFFFLSFLLSFLSFFSFFFNSLFANDTIKIQGTTATSNNTKITGKAKEGEKEEECTSFVNHLPCSFSFFPPATAPAPLPPFLLSSFKVTLKNQPWNFPLHFSLTGTALCFQKRISAFQSKSSRLNFMAHSCMYFRISSKGSRSCNTEPRLWLRMDRAK